MNQVTPTSNAMKTLLVPLDGSPAAEAVLPAATTLARALPARLSLLHSIERDAPDRVHGERHLTGVAEAEAYLAIQRQSRQRRKSKKEIAEAIVLAEELRRAGGRP